jgi:hypothetical protein
LPQTKDGRLKIKNYELKIMKSKVVFLICICCVHTNDGTDRAFVIARNEAIQRAFTSWIASSLAMTWYRHCGLLQTGMVLFNRLQGSKTAARVWDCCVHTGESLSPSGESIAEVSATLSPHGETIAEASEPLSPHGETIAEVSAAHSPLGETIAEASAALSPLAESTDAQFGRLYPNSQLSTLNSQLYYEDFKFTFQQSPQRRMVSAVHRIA